MAVRARKEIIRPDWVRDNPLASVDSIAGVRIHHVGQGDALALLGPDLEPVVRLDYGGRVSSPFRVPGGEHRRIALIDKKLPVGDPTTVFLSHWDEDHWCSARPGTQVETRGRWVTPRQFTSPRAVAASTRMRFVRCLPESWGQTPLVFKARDGDQLIVQKLAAFDVGALNADCNLNGLAFAICAREQREVIFLSGDAPPNLVGAYRGLDPDAWAMRGICAYHHGSVTHWTADTDAFLRRWRNDAVRQDIVFSYGAENAYGHPHRDAYAQQLPRAVLTDAIGSDYRDILFSEPKALR